MRSEEEYVKNMEELPKSQNASKHATVTPLSHPVSKNHGERLRSPATMPECVTCLPASAAAIAPLPSALNTTAVGGAQVAGNAMTKVSTTSIHQELATVNRGFLPSLPDELHIHHGECIRIINAYDDGWCLCANQRGEQGVVPLECLMRTSRGARRSLTSYGESSSSLQELSGDVPWRLSQRASSLFAGSSPQGHY